MEIIPPESKDINKKTAGLYAGILIAFCAVLILLRETIVGTGDGSSPAMMTPLGFDIALIAILVISAIIIIKTSLRKRQKDGK